MNTAYRVVVSIQVTIEYYYENGIQYSVTQKQKKNYSYSVFSREFILSYKVIISIHLYEKVSIQYSIQYSVMLTGRYSVFNTVFSLDDL